MRLDGKIAVITGGARGIGRAIAQQISKLGAKVSLFDVSDEVKQTEQLIVDAGGQAHCERVDVTDKSAIETAVEATRKRWGAIDILVNNAGIVNNIAPLQRMTHQSWQHELDVNLTGAFNMIQAVIPDMVEHKWGRIVNISSGAARGGLYYQAAYAASKAGLLGLTSNATIEFGRHGVTCNAILPGLIGTENVLNMPPEILQEALDFVPAARVGEPGEVAWLVAFLVSDWGGYINGAEIPIDGGAGTNAIVLGSRSALRHE